jgi:hypothetical protein
MVRYRADLQLEIGGMGSRYGVAAGGGALNIAELQTVLTALLDIYQSSYQLTLIPNVARLLFQDYAHIRSKHIIKISRH